MLTAIWLFIVAISATNGLKKSEICENRSSLDNIDVFVQFNQQDNMTKIESFNFSQLNNSEYTVIDVTRANLSILCEKTVQKLPSLEKLTLINVGLEDIEDQAFYDVPHLTYLSLAANRLTAVKRGYFENVKSLKVLSLSANSIATIDANAFDPLVHLKKIYLDRNELRKINSDLFVKMMHIVVIDLSFNSVNVPQILKTLKVRKDTEIRLRHNVDVDITAAGATGEIGKSCLIPLIILIIIIVLNY